MGFKGSVESFSLADVFQNLSMNQQTGTLHVIAGASQQKHVFFQDGQVRFMAREADNPLLTAETFVARGLLAPEHLPAVAERSAQSPEPLRASLLALGLADDAVIAEVLRHQIEEEIFDLFSWEKASFEFNEGAPPDGFFADQRGLKVPGLPVSHLIMEAARRVDEWERLRKQVPSFKEIYCIDPVARGALEKGEMEVDAVERRVVSLIDGSRDVDDLIEDSGLFKFEVLSALGSFLQSSLIRPAALQELSLAEQECLRAPRRRIKVLERMLAVGGENKRTRKELAELLAQELLVERACIHFDVLAAAELQAGREDGAVENLCRILAIAPQHINAHEQLAALYMKRGQKREAFIHFRELFEILREQNHLLEARNACARALECEPLHLELRGALAELLIADNQKALAAQQLELLGDQTAKTGNIKTAADCYRRAMQFRANDKQLKKKLADAMLTKEDRRARKRKLTAILSVAGLILLAFGALLLLEYSNGTKYAEALKQADRTIKEAGLLESEGKFTLAAGQYRLAESFLLPSSRLFSPLKRYHARASTELVKIRQSQADAAAKGEQLQADGVKRAQADLANARAALKEFDLYEAQKLFELVLANPCARAEDADAARAALAEAGKLIERLELGLQKLKKNPNTEFAGIEDEIQWKRKFIEEFKNQPKLTGADTIRLPLRIQPETDNMDVFLDGTLWGTIRIGGTKEQNTLRYPALGSHRLDFRRPGYRSVTLNTSDIQASVFVARLERQPAVTIDAGAELQGHWLSGDVLADGDTLYIGTSEGGLLQVTLGEKPRIRGYSLRGGGLNREVVGAPMLVKQPGKPDLVVYCTKAGDCVGLVAAEQGLREAWTPVKGDPAAVLTAKPALLKLALLNHYFCVIPVDRKLLLVDCENGALLRTLELRQSATCSPILWESAILSGCGDGNLYAVNLNGDVVAEWSSSARAAALRGRPVFFEDLLILGAEDGRLYLFNSKKTGSHLGEIPLEGALQSDPLIVKKRLYIGSMLRENLYCVDLVARRELWRKSDPGMGGVNCTPAALDKRIYFVTTAGRLYAIDAEKGSTRWIYQLEAGRRFICAPLAVGHRIYAVTNTGSILGFDEQPDE